MCRCLVQATPAPPLSFSQLLQGTALGAQDLLAARTAHASVLGQPLGSAEPPAEGEMGEGELSRRPLRRRRKDGNLPTGLGLGPAPPLAAGLGLGLATPLAADMMPASVSDPLPAAQQPKGGRTQRSTRAGQLRTEGQGGSATPPHVGGQAGPVAFPQPTLIRRPRQPHQPPLAPHVQKVSHKAVGHLVGRFLSLQREQGGVSMLAKHMAASATASVAAPQARGEAGGGGQGAAEAGAGEGQHAAPVSCERAHVGAAQLTAWRGKPTASGVPSAPARGRVHTSCDPLRPALKAGAAGTVSERRNTAQLALSKSKSTPRAAAAPSARGEVEAEAVLSGLLGDECGRLPQLPSPDMEGVGNLLYVSSTALQPHSTVTMALRSRKGQGAGAGSGSAAGAQRQPSEEGGARGHSSLPLTLQSLPPPLPPLPPAARGLPPPLEAPPKVRQVIRIDAHAMCCAKLASEL